ncbi:MAG: hypothetical protein U1F59_00860 [Candidatus Competibacteraceae bacterium]
MTGKIFGGLGLHTLDAAALASKLKISEPSAIHLVAHLASKGKVNPSVRAIGAK